MPYDLAAMVKASGARRNIVLRPIEPARGPEQDLARLYLAVLKAWSPDAILGGYTGGMTTDAPSDQTNAIAEAENTVTRLIAEFTAGLRDWVVRTERIHRSRWTAAVKSATTIDLQYLLTGGEVQETLDVFLDRNVALVRNVSDQVRGRIADAVFRGYQERRPARDVAKEISEATGLARDRSRRIASHQNAVLSGALDQQRQAEAGITAWRWRSSHKKHARPHHAAREGNIYDAKTRKQLNPDTTVMEGGETIDAGDEPSQPPFCGCRRQAYLAIMAELDI